MPCFAQNITSRLLLGQTRNGFNSSAKVRVLSVVAPCISKKTLNKQHALFDKTLFLPLFCVNRCKHYSSTWVQTEGGQHCWTGFKLVIACNGTNLISMARGHGTETAWGYHEIPKRNCDSQSQKECPSKPFVGKGG